MAVTTTKKKSSRRRSASKQVVQKPSKPVYDLNKTQDRKAYDDLGGNTEGNEDTYDVLKRCEFVDFVNKGQKSSIIYGMDAQVFRGSGTGYYAVIMIDNELFAIDDNIDSMNADELIDKIDDCEGEVPAGVWLAESKMILLNGDLDDIYGCGLDDVIPTEISRNMPTVSFKCLEQFYKEGVGVKGVIERLSKGKLVYRDHTDDDSFAVTAEQAKRIRDARKNKIPLEIKSPKRGYTLLGERWHRPGAVLLYDKEYNWTILTGQDDDSYFGVELQGSAEKVGEALESLIPKEVRNKEFERQGEWFITSVDKKDVPEKADCILLADSGGNAGGDSSVYLPIETEDSNRHWLFSKDVRVTKDGRVFALNPELVHDDHPDTEKDGWCTFHKNTAIRSYSQEGVD